MSVANKSAVSALKDIESWIRCPETSYRWGTTPLSKNNAAFVQDLYTLLSCFWYDTTFHPELLNRRWVSAIQAEPVDKVVSFLKEVDEIIVSQTICSMASFKHWRKANYPTMGQFIAPLVDNLDLWFTDGQGLKGLRTCLRFITRANFPESLGLEEEAIAGWRETCLAEPTVVSLDTQADIVSSIFPKRKTWYWRDDLRPRFGPGRCADPRIVSTEDKYLYFTTDTLLDYTAQKLCFPTGDLPRCSTGQIRTHRIQFVPKQLDKLRVVSMEPQALMFYQLGIQKAMCDDIRRSRWRAHIDLERADLNQDLAWLGSITGEYATIDLSSASDTVRLQQVKRLFRQSWLYGPLIGTRSSHASIDGEIVSPTYFAPMGSGTCFPVECVVFASFVEKVMCQNRDRRAWRVYGDDIILPTDRAIALMDELEESGFLVNRSKSFYSQGSGFRESCGGDYFAGEDVRPIYISRFWSGLTCKASRPSTIEGNVDLANRLTAFPLTRQRVITSLLEVRPRVLFDDTGELGIFSKYPTNFDKKSRYNADLQRTEYRCGILRTSVNRGSGQCEDIRLYEWLRQHQDRQGSPDDGPVSIGRPSRPSWRVTWRSPAPGWEGRG